MVTNFMGLEFNKRISNEFAINIHNREELLDGLIESVFAHWCLKPVVGVKFFSSPSQLYPSYKRRVTCNLQKRLHFYKLDRPYSKVKTRYRAKCPCHLNDNKRETEFLRQQGSNTKYHILLCRRHTFLPRFVRRKLRMRIIHG